MFIFEFELDQKDFINLGKDKLTIPKYGKPYLINAGIGIIILYIIFLSIFKNWQGYVYPTIFAFIIILIISNNGRSMYKIAKDVDTMRKYEFKSDGFTMTTNSCTTNYAYTSIKEVYNTPNSIIFVDNKGIMHFIPKRVAININLYGYLMRKINA